MKSLPTIDRRRFLKGTAAAAAASIAAPAIVRAQTRELRILTWEGYAGPEWLDKFKSDTGATVNIVYAGSADEMFAKMQGSQAADFDIVSFDTSLFPRYIDAKLIQPMDPAKIPNLKNIAPEFADVKAVMKGEERYGLPFAWGSLPLVYDKAAFPTPPESWEVMWDEQYAQQMLWMDDANNSITTAALVVGAANPYQLTDEDFAKVRDKLIAQKKMSLSYYAGFDDGVNLFAQNSIKLTVLGVLADKNIAPIKFMLGDFGVAPNMYSDVADAVKNSKITVLVEPSLKSTKVQALYINELKLPNGKFMYNLMLLRDPDLAGGVTDAREKINTEFNAMMGIVHECTHAGFDARKLKKVSTPYNEGAAYIAGAIFAVAKMRDMGGKPEKVYASTTKTDIHSVAWGIALNLEKAKDKTIPTDRANALFVEIGKMPEYKDKMKDIVTLDGIDQKW